MEASYTLGYPWLVDLLSGRALPVDLTAGWEIPNAGWRDSQTVFLCTFGGLYRLDVSSEGEGPAPSDVAPTPLAVYTPEEPSWIQGFGISPDRKTVVLAEPGTLLFLDASTLQITSRTEAAFPDDLFCDPGTEWSWSLPITWIPGRSAIALERINDGVQSVFAVPSGHTEQTVFSGRGGQDVTSVIAWSPDGQAVLAARPTLAIVTGTGETPLASAWQVDDRIKKLPDGAFSPPGNYVAIGYQGKVYVHSAATGALEAAFDGRLLNWSAEEDRVWVIREVRSGGGP